MMLSKGNRGTPDWNVSGEIFLVDKPMDWTSFDVVKKIRSLFHIRKIGHAGTLDPKATGLLILATGPRTKEMTKFVSWEKEYEGTIELGILTASFDTETPVLERREVAGISEERILETARKFIGRQLQMPPMFSAVKHEGKPLYKFARKGKVVERPEKSIEIRLFGIERISLPYVNFRVVCSKGTYIRALAHDFGEALGCGATLKMLRRTRIGNARVEDAFTIEDLQALKPEWSKDSHARRPAESSRTI